MARFMARNSKWPENIFYGQRGANMARFEKSGHQMANLATLSYVITSIQYISLPADALRNSKSGFGKGSKFEE